MRENVEVAALGVGASPGTARRTADELLGLLGLDGYAEPRPVRSPTATSAPRRRARARDTADVRADGRARGGAPEAEVPEFAAVVRSVRDDHGAGVLLIDHNMALIMDVCDRIQVLDQGRARGGPREIAQTSTSPRPTSARAPSTRAFVTGPLSPSPISRCGTGLWPPSAGCRSRSRPARSSG